MVCTRFLQYMYYDTMCGGKICTVRTRLRHFRLSILAKYVIFRLSKNPEICCF